MDDCPSGTTKLYIGGLDEKATSKDIEAVFSRFSSLGDIWIAKNPPGFAFVDFSDYQDAIDAVARLDGAKIAGTRVRVEISNQGRNPSTFAATFKKKKGPVRSGFTFFGNKNNATRQCTGTTGFKKNFNRVNEGKVTSKFSEKSSDERNSRKEALILKSREYSIPKSYSTRDDKREDCEEKFELKREIKTEEKWNYSRHKEERQTLRERSRDSWDRRDRKRYSSPERYREQGTYSEERKYPVYEDRCYEKRRDYPEYYDRYTENEYPPFPTRYRDRSQRRSRSRSHSPRRDSYSPRRPTYSPRHNSYSPRDYHQPPRYSPERLSASYYQPREYHPSTGHYPPSYSQPPPSKRSRY